MKVINFTTDTDTVETNNEYFIDGIVLMGGREIFRVPDIGWIHHGEVDDIIAAAFAERLAEVLT